MEQMDYHTFRLGGLDCREEITVASQYSRIGDLVLGGKKGQINTHQDVYSLLLEDGFACRGLSSILQSTQSNLEARNPVEGVVESLSSREPIRLVCGRWVRLIGKTIVVIRSQDLFPAGHFRSKFPEVYSWNCKLFSGHNLEVPRIDKDGNSAHGSIS